jgi:hypothetical protein
MTKESRIPNFNSLEQRMEPMRRIIAWTAAAALLGGLGCTHEVCDCCQDPCSACQYPGCGSRAVAVPAPLPAPAAKSEPVPAPKSAPTPPPAAPKAGDSKDSGKKVDGPTLDD